MKSEHMERLKVDIDVDDFLVWHKKRYNWKPDRGIAIAMREYALEKALTEEKKIKEKEEW